MFTLHTTNLTFSSSLFCNEDEPFPSVIVLAKLLRVCSTFFVNKREFSENLRSLEDTIIVENFLFVLYVLWKIVNPLNLKMTPLAFTNSSQNINRLKFTRNLHIFIKQRFWKLQSNSWPCRRSELYCIYWFVKISLNYIACNLSVCLISIQVKNETKISNFHGFKVYCYQKAIENFALLKKYMNIWHIGTNIVDWISLSSEK